MNDLKAFFKKDGFNLLIFVLSIIILIIGTIVLNFLIALLIFILINLIWFIPFIKWKEKLDKRKQEQIDIPENVYNDDF